ncbi:Uncharacterised protein [Vibrio cholerae]|nr:Uncharacterised protein [Vibrio cholerae]
MRLKCREFTHSLHLAKLDGCFLNAHRQIWHLNWCDLLSAL